MSPIPKLTVGRKGVLNQARALCELCSNKNLLDAVSQERPEKKHRQVRRQPQRAGRGVTVGMRTGQAGGQRFCYQRRHGNVNTPPLRDPEVVGVEE